MKRCSACGETLAADQFSKRTRSADGLQGRCKACNSAFNRARYADPEYRAQRLEANREWHRVNRESARVRHLAARRARAEAMGPRRPVARDGFKYCGRCGEQKPLGEFHRHGRTVAGYCKPCACDHRRKWYLANRERHIENVRAYERERPEWKRMAQRVVASAYRARKANAAVAGAPVTAEAVRNRWDMWGGACYVCGDAATETDHVIPIKRGGLHVPANLRPICRHCNATKSASDWRATVRS